MAAGENARTYHVQATVAVAETQTCGRLPPITTMAWPLAPIAMVAGAEIYRAADALKIGANENAVGCATAASRSSNECRETKPFWPPRCC